MRRLLIFSLLTSLVLGLGLASPSARADTARGDTSDAAAEIVPMDVLAALRQGGHIIYFRHAATDHDTVDQQRQDLGDCSTQRNLSPLGRQQAAAIGDAFHALEIPVGEVLSSPYCRCMDTARLAFGRVEAEPDLAFALGRGTEETERLSRALGEMLTRAPQPGVNTVIAGHTVNLREATGIWPKPEGAAIIFAPDGSGGFSFRAAVHPDSWGRTVTARRRTE